MAQPTPDSPPDPAGDHADADPARDAGVGDVPGRIRWRRVVKRLAVATTAVVATLVLLVGTAWAVLTYEYSGEVSARARGTGHDAEWLGHAWVDGRKTQADVDALAVQLRGTGIHDLFVHTGPFNDDGTLDPGQRPRARWLIGAVHHALPGVRVQAWLGAHPVPGQLDLASPATRAAVLTSVAQVLDDGFDGIHYDFEPVRDGNTDLLTMLRATRPLTRQRHALLSVSATHTEPWPGPARGLRMLTGSLTMWSTGYLHQVAVQVDQVALMAYDTALWTQASYGGYVRRITESALDAVPTNVALFIGVPAYQDEHPTHHRHAETVAAALRGIRLGLGDRTPPRRDVGVAVYVDFTVTRADWATYHRDWATP